jgi:AraC-like DNA-binding protein
MSAIVVRVDGPRIEQSRQAADPPVGILGVPGRLPFSVRRFRPAEDLTWCVELFWVSSWDVPGDQVAVTRILPHPSVNLTLQEGRLWVTGVPNGVFSRHLTGSGSVFGVKFRPGVFHLLADTPVRGLSGTGQSAHGVLPGSTALERSLGEAADDEQRAEQVEGYLRWRRVMPDRGVRIVGDAVEALTQARPGVRVDDVARQLGVSGRTLQRLFAEYVGVTPGWVLRRSRLQAAAERVIQLAATDQPRGWADVAAELGYADQAHFIRDFRRVLGVPPASWAAALVSEEVRG